jgi:hypothetical protein
LPSLQNGFQFVHLCVCPSCISQLCSDHVAVPHRTCVPAKLKTLSKSHESYVDSL